jgi:murein DD-endopeptidase MepM/ murein hydrolase activator NlpD
MGLLVLLLSLVALPGRAAIADGGQPGVVTSPDGVNLRSGPSTGAGILTVMPNGAQVLITGAAQSGNWLPVIYNGQNGFADGDYITAGGTSVTASGSSSSGAAALAASPSPSATPTSSSATVMPSDGLNLRSGPGSSYGVLTVMPQGATVAITGPAQNGTWEPVIYNGQSGFADGSYLSTDGSDPIVTASGAGASGNATLALSATPTASPGARSSSSATPAPPTSGYRLAWPSTQRRISTVFSPAHLGIDIDEFSAPNEPIHASAAGTVVFAGGDPCCSYGLYVDVDHGNGLLTRYAHMSVVKVKVGQVVQQGDVLGNVGCTGKCTGNHIHYEVHVNGTPVDPLSMLPPPWSIE